MLSQHRHTTTVTLTAGLSLELECTLAIQAGALSRGVACLSALLSGCQDRTILSKYSAWTRRDIDPDAVEEEAEEIEAAAAAATGREMSKGGGDEKGGLPLPGAITAANTNVRHCPHAPGCSGAWPRCACRGCGSTVLTPWGPANGRIACRSTADAWQTTLEQCPEF